MSTVWATSRFVTTSPTTVKGIFIPEEFMLAPVCFANIPS